MVGDERCLSGVDGLDNILAGGFPRGGFYLIQGDPGSGKTTLALQFLLEGLRRSLRATANFVNHRSRAAYGEPVEGRNFFRDRA